MNPLGWFANRKRRRTASTLTLTGVAALLVALAATADGRPLHELSLNDGSVWVTSQSELKMARLNAQIGQLDQGLTVTGGEAFDVEQDRDLVLLNAAPKLDVVDITRVERSVSVTVPADAKVRLGARTVGILDPAEGKLWLRDADELAGFSTDDDEALDVGAGALLTMSKGGTAYVLDPSAGVIHQAGIVDGAIQTSEVGSIGDKVTTEAAQLTVVGEHPVVLDTVGSRLLQPGADPITVPGLDENARIQSAGAERGTVAVASRTTLFRIPLGGGDLKSTPFGGEGLPAEPLMHNGCLHAAWADPDGKAYVRLCDGHDEYSAVIGEVASTAELRFRTNRNVVVLNDLVSGYSWLPQEKMRLVKNWDDISAEKRRKKAESTQSDKIDKRNENRRPVLKDDDLGARPDRDTILKVLANDADPDGDLLTITKVTMDPGSSRYAEAVKIVGDETELQLTLGPQDRGKIKFTYTASDGRPNGEATANVTVTVREDHQNTAPAPDRGPAKAAVAAGETISAYVLAHWKDADGDDLVLTKATAPKGGSVSFRPDGLVTYTDEGTREGSRAVEVHVSDGRKTTKGRMQVTVLPPGPQAPETVPDHERATAGQPQVVSPLLNDISLDGGNLTLASARPSSKSSAARGGTPQITVDHDAGTFAFEAAEEGTYFVDYGARTSGPTHVSTVRIDVQPPREANRSPIAVKDRADVPEGGSELVDVLGNDTDPDGDLLAIQSVSIPDELPIKVAVVERRLLRIDTPVDITSQIEAGLRVTYTVTDGQDTATAGITLRQFRPPDRNRAPIAVDDEITVRSGDVATVDVLANDRDPDGDPLTLDATAVEGSDRDSALKVFFAAGDTIRLQGPEVDTTVRMRATYIVTDPYGKTASATVHISVVPRTGVENRPPTAGLIEGRAIAGKATKIRIPLNGIDPDGDSVRFVGLVNSPTRGYIKSSGPGWIEYEAYAASDGTAGVDRFDVALADRFGARATAPVKVVVSPRATKNHPPVALDDTIVVRPGRTVHYDALANDTDADNDALTLVESGSDEIGDSIVTLTAPEDEGQVSRRYSVWDGFGGIDSAVLTVIADKDAPLHAPIAVDDVVDPAQVAGKDVGDAITVDVMRNDFDPDGDRASMSISSSHGKVVDGKLEILLSPKTKIIRYKLADSDDKISYGFVTVVGVDEVPPVVSPAKLDLETRAWVNIGETLPIDLDEFVLVRKDRRPQLPGKGLLTATGGEITRSGDRTLELDASSAEPGVVTLTVEVNDGGDGALTSVLAIPVVVRNPENVPPVVEPLNLDLAIKDKDGILLTPEAFITDSDARDDPRCKLTAAGDITITAQSDGCGMIIRPKEDAEPGSYARITVVATDDSQATTEGIIDVRLVAKVDLTNRLKFPDFVAELNRELKVDIDDYVTDEKDRGRLRVVSAGGHDFSANVISVKPAKIGAIVVPVKVRNADDSATLSSSFRVEVGARPNAPGRPSAVHVESGRVTVRWTTPDANGYPIQKYIVEAGGVSRDCGPAPQCVIDDLDNGRDYVFRVSAQNELGRGPASPPSAPARPDEMPRVMSAPGVGYITDGKIGVRLSWSAPSNDGSEITGYELVRNDTGTIEKLGPRARSYQDMSVNAGQTYRYQIRAINGTREKQDFSAWVNATPYGLPGTPGRPNASAVSGGREQTYEFSWSAADANGAPVDYYTVTVSGHGSERVSGTTARVRNLRVGTTYRVRITAHNKAGEGPASAENTFTPSEAPSAPAAPRIVLAGDSHASVEWSYDRDDFNGGRDAHFRIEDNHGNTLSRRVSSKERNAVVRLRTAGSSTQVRVIAANDKGEAASDWSDAVTPVGEPGRPHVTATGGAGSARFSWTPPEPHGGALRTQIRIECSVNGLFGTSRDCRPAERDPRFLYGDWIDWAGGQPLVLEGDAVRYTVHVRGVATDIDGSDIEGESGSASQFTGSPPESSPPPAMGLADPDRNLTILRTWFATRQ